MGSSTSRPEPPRPVRVCTLLTYSTVGLFGLRFIARRLRRPAKQTAVFRSPHPSSVKFVGVNLTAVDCDVYSFFPNSTQEIKELHVLGSKMYPTFFNSLERLTNLRVLELRGVEVEDKVDLSFLRRLHNLRTLVIDDCYELTSGGLDIVLELPRLGRLELGIEALAQLSYEFCASCSIELSLILYGPRCLNDFLKLMAIQNLVSLSFIDFWTLVYPLWMREMPKLRCLSFKNGIVKKGQDDDTDVFPPSLEHFSCVSCCMDRHILEATLRSADRLTKLELDFPFFPEGIAISHCTNLKVLSISAKECDGEMLQQLSSNKALRVIELSGCCNLTPQHFVVLDHRHSLDKISISCSYVGPGICEQLAALKGLRCLEFHYCLGINLNELRNARGLRCLVLNKCHNVQGDVNEFLTSLLSQRLDSLYFEEISPVS